MRIVNNGKTLVADDGKLIMCTCHNVILGTEVHLNKIMYNDNLIDDSIKNYIEIDIPKTEDEQRLILKT